jgi:hypothetical protein
VNVPIVGFAFDDVACYAAVGEGGGGQGCEGGSDCIFHFKDLEVVDEGWDLQVCVMIFLHDLGSCIYVSRANYQYFSLVPFGRATYLFAWYTCLYEYPNVR